MWLKVSNKYEPLVIVSLGQENHVGKLAQYKASYCFYYLYFILIVEVLCDKVSLLVNK